MKSKIYTAEDYMVMAILILYFFVPTVIALHALFIQGMANPVIVWAIAISFIVAMSIIRPPKLVIPSLMLIFLIIFIVSFFLPQVHL